MGESAEKDAQAERRALVFEFRVRGLTVREIAKQIGVSPATVSRDITAVLGELAETTHQDAESVRRLELERLDLATQYVCATLTSENVGQEMRLKAVDRLTRINERRSKLLGLDAPERKLHGYDGSKTPAEIARVVQDKFGSVGPDCETDDEAKGSE